MKTTLLAFALATGLLGVSVTTAGQAQQSPSQQVSAPNEPLGAGKPALTPEQKAARKARKAQLASLPPEQRAAEEAKDQAARKAERKAELAKMTPEQRAALKAERKARKAAAQSAG